MKVVPIAALALLATTVAATAHGYPGHRIDRREAIQERRIEEGLRHGQLTRHEARLLEHQQARIRAMEHHARRDGYIDRREARRIEWAQDAASRRIATERRDRQRQGYWYRRWW
jgi:Spy/CpxP family protein refolding chaperone